MIGGALMSDGQTHSQRYCADLVRARDEDRWLAAQYAHVKEARRLMALYAFHSELRRIPGAVSEPPLGEIRLQWWREALQELRDGKRARAHPVVEEIALAGLADADFADDVESLIAAAARPLYDAGFAGADDLAGWLRQSEGTLDTLGARLLGGDADLAAQAGEAGALFALAREGAWLAPDLAHDIQERLARPWAALRAPAAVAPALLHLCLTRAYARRGRKPFPVLKRLRLFAAMAAGRI